MPNIPPLSDKIVYRQWSRTTQNKGREAGEVQEWRWLFMLGQLRCESIPWRWRLKLSRRLAIR
jgi:hypothetical protein